MDADMGLDSVNSRFANRSPLLYLEDAGVKGGMGASPARKRIASVLPPRHRRGR